MQYKSHFAHSPAMGNVHQHYSPIGPDGSNFIFQQSDPDKLISASFLYGKKNPFNSAVTKTETDKMR